MLTASISVHGTEEKYTITTGLSRNEMQISEEVAIDSQASLQKP
jgi:hypothetical protein